MVFKEVGILLLVARIVSLVEREITGKRVKGRVN